MRKKLLRRALAVCLAVTLLAPMTVLSGASGFTPLTASALEVEPQTIDSGSCGNDVNYILNDANVLTISGWGSMGNYFFSPKDNVVFFCEYPCDFFTVAKVGCATLANHG